MPPPKPAKPPKSTKPSKMKSKRDQIKMTRKTASPSNVSLRPPNKTDPKHLIGSFVGNWAEWIVTDPQLAWDTSICITYGCYAVSPNDAIAASERIQQLKVCRIPEKSDVGSGCDPTSQMTPTQEAKKNRIGMMREMLVMLKGKQQLRRHAKEYPEKPKYFPMIYEQLRATRLTYGYGDSSREDGRQITGSIPMLVMEKPLVTLDQLVCFAPPSTLPLALAARLAFGCVTAVDALHQLGFIHRTIAPYCFAIRQLRATKHTNRQMAAELVQMFEQSRHRSTSVPEETLTAALEQRYSDHIIISGFVHSRRWPNLAQRKPRSTTPFVGTLRYSSVRALDLREQGPIDDQFSVLYMMMEWLQRDNLRDWARKRTRLEVFDIKKKIRKTKLWQRLPQTVTFAYEVLEKAQNQDPLGISPTFEMQKTFAICQENANSKKGWKSLQDMWPAWSSLHNERKKTTKKGTRTKTTTA